MNVSRVLWDSATAAPERIAIRDGAASWTYGALVARAAAIGEALTTIGLRAGDRVAILLPHGPDAAAAFYGTASAGGVATVLNWLYRPRQVEQVLSDAEAGVLVTTRAWEEMQVRPLDREVTTLFVEDLPMTGSTGPLEAGGDSPVQICYTSGSTGTPKGVVMSHDNLGIGMRTVVDYLRIEASDHIASVLPFSFVYGFNQLNCAIATGARLDIISATMAPEIVRSLKEHESTVLAAVPPIWTQLLRVEDFNEPLASLRLLTCAGGRLSPESVRALRIAQPQASLFLMYGLTEVFRSTYLPAEEVDAHPDSMGRAVPGSEVYVVREDGSLCADEEVGELVHAGPTVGLGYWRSPEATAAVFRANPTRRTDPPFDRAVFSGDLVRRDAGGRLFYVGRRDRMIKTLGFRVSPDEITDVIYASRQVTEAVVTSEADPVRGERVVAHVVLAPEGTLAALRRYCGVELPRHMQPAQWDVRETLPRNASGKHDLLVLRTEREQKSGH